MQCNHCGKTLHNDSAFCSFCGTKIDPQTTTRDDAPCKKYALLGFRSNKTWKKISSILYLVLCATILLACLITKHYAFTSGDLIAQTANTIILFLILVSPYIFLSNTKMRNALPLFKTHQRGKSALGMSIIIICLLIVYGIIYGTHSQEYLAEQKGHDYQITITRQATCTNEGAQTYTCSRCGKSHDETIPVENHVYSETIEKEATCTDQGLVLKKCNICGREEQKTVTAFGHSYESSLTKEATCGVPGVKTNTCSICHNSYSEEIFVNHSWQEATCTSPQTCSTCGATEGIPLGHSCDLGVCSHCHEEIKKQSPVTILEFKHTEDYVGGIEWTFKIRNNTPKQIKYVTIRWDCYNAVGDLIQDSIDGKTYVQLRFTGPLDAYATSTTKRNSTRFYNSTYNQAKLTRLVVEYMDGTTETLNEYYYGYHE